MGCVNSCLTTCTLIVRQVELLKEELNKEMELNSALQTAASRQQQTLVLTVGAALAAAAALAALLYKRR